MFLVSIGHELGKAAAEENQKIERKCFHEWSERKTQNQKAMENFSVFLGLLKIKFLAIYFDCDFSFSPSTQKIYESWSRMCGWCNKECEKYGGKKLIVPSTASWSSLTLPNFASLFSVSCWCFAARISIALVVKQKKASNDFGNLRRLPYCSQQLRCNWWWWRRTTARSFLPSRKSLSVERHEFFFNSNPFEVNLRLLTASRTVDFWSRTRIRFKQMIWTLGWMDK